MSWRYVFAKPPSGRVWGTWIAGPLALRRVLAHKDTDLYIMLNPADSPRHLKPSASSIVALEAILIDIDPITTDADPLRAAHEAATLAHGLGPPEDSVEWINSGRGFQLWLRLDPIPLDARNRGALGGRVRRLIHQLARGFGTRHGCRVDTSTCDLCRLGRLPGSINQKTGRRAYVVKRGRPKAAGWLWELDPLTPEPVAVPARASTRLVDLMPALTDKAWRFVTSGIVAPGRHSACYAALRSLAESGAPESVAERAALAGAALCEPALEPSHVMRTLRQIYERGDR